jgi:polysaccharide biosynthesis protein VpsQ
MKALRWLAVLFVLFFLLVLISAEFGRAQAWFGFLYFFPFGDAVGHMLLLGMLSFLITLGFSSTRFHRPPLLKTCVVIAGLITLEEFSQLFVPNRTFSLVDLAANYTGIFAFGELAAALRRRLTAAASL